jgi:hypothetical protein
MITPTVGRVVWFQQMTPGVFPGSEKTRAAIIAHVHNDRLVNLCVIDANGATLSRTSVQLVQEGDELPVTMHCTWMPYQLGQSAKTEALEKKLAEK